MAGGDQQFRRSTMQYSLQQIASTSVFVTLKTELRVVQDHWKWRCSIDHTTFYWSAIVTIISILYYFRVIRRWIIRDLEIWLTGHSRSLKLVPCESSGAVSYSPSVVTMALCCAVAYAEGGAGRSWPPMAPSKKLIGMVLQTKVSSERHEYLK